MLDVGYNGELLGIGELFDADKLPLSVHNIYDLKNVQYVTDFSYEIIIESGVTKVSLVYFCHTFFSCVNNVMILHMVLLVTYK